VYREANGQHWQRVMQTIEEPLVAWQAEEGASATEAQAEE
jgi:hypothetical protein